MARRPRPPVPAEGLLGHGLEGVLAEHQLDPVELEHPLVLLDQRVLRLHQDADQGFLVEAGDGTTTGSRPMNSGISPNLIRSSGRTWRRTSESRGSVVRRTSARKPIPLRPIRLSMILSRPAKAPPQRKRMLVVSIWMNS